MPGGATWLVVSSKKTKVKTLKVDEADEAMIKAASRLWAWRQESEILRVAIRVGLKSLRHDPSPLGQGPLDPSFFDARPEDLAKARQAVSEALESMESERDRQSIETLMEDVLEFYGRQPKPPRPSPRR